MHSVTETLGKLSQYIGNQKTTGKFSNKLNLYMVRYIAYKSTERCPSAGAHIRKID